MKSLKLSKFLKTMKFMKSFKLSNARKLEALKKVVVADVVDAEWAQETGERYAGMAACAARATAMVEVDRLASGGSVAAVDAGLYAVEEVLPEVQTRRSSWRRQVRSVRRWMHWVNWRWWRRWRRRFGSNVSVR